MNNLPKNLAHPGGFVEEVMNYINSTAVCPQPMFALGAALTLAGTIYGRKVQGSDGQRTNLFVMAVGFTSSGKDHPLKAIAGILDRCGASNLRLGQVTSDSAIEWALKREPRLCLLIDEAGHFFSGVSDPKAKGSPQHSIKPALLELWSSAGSRWVGKQRVPKDGKTAQEPVTIDSPHLCMYATTQPQILFSEGLTRSDLRDGWLARNLFFISKDRPKPEFKELKAIPNSILAEVFEYKDESGQVNELVTVPTNDEAMEVFRKFNDKIYAKMIAADKSGEESNYLYGKALENSRRIALILAVSKAKSAYEAVITKEEAEYATGLVSFLVSTVIDEVEECLAENVDEKNIKRIFKLISDAGANGLTRNELTRKAQHIRRTMREEYLTDLIDSNRIVVRDTLSGKNHLITYFLKGLEPKN